MNISELKDLLYEEYAKLIIELDGQAYKSTIPHKIQNRILDVLNYFKCANYSGAEFDTHMDRFNPVNPTLPAIVIIMRLPLSDWDRILLSPHIPEIQEKIKQMLDQKIT